MKILKIIIHLLCVLSLAACGGGTTGTGDQEPRFTIAGKILNQSGESLENIQIADARSGTEAQSDAQGNFTLVLPQKQAQLSLLIKGPNLDSSVTVEIRNTEDDFIEIELRVDSVSGIVSYAEVTSTPQEPDKPAPTATPEIRQTPTPKPTAESGAATLSIAGSVVSSLGKAFSGVEIFFLDGQSVTTNSSGGFSKKISSSTGTLSLKINYRALSGDLVVKGLPRSGNQSVTLRIVLSIESSRIDPDDPSSENQDRLVVSVGRVSVL